jgi:predicted murein hydrolase (TIGR00659 family)
MNNILSSPLFGIVLCVAAFALGVAINQKVKSPIANPLLIAIAFVIIILKIFNISLKNFDVGGDIITMLLAPATVVLALSIYKQKEILKKHFFPILIGCLAGSLTSMISAFLLCKAFQLDHKLTASMIPKSVTTPIAMEISRQGGGIVPVTVAAVIITGILGAILSPLLIKLFRVNNPVAAGVAIGACSHAVGTSKAIELGEIEGAMSGLSLCISGIITVILSLFI